MPDRRFPLLRRVALLDLRSRVAQVCHNTNRLQGFGQCMTDCTGGTLGSTVRRGAGETRGPSELSGGPSEESTYASRQRCRQAPVLAITAVEIS